MERGRRGRERWREEGRGRERSKAMNKKTDFVPVLLLSLIPKDTPDKQYPL